MSKLRARGHAKAVGGKESKKREQLAQAVGLWAHEKLGLEEANIPPPEDLKL